MTLAQILIPWSLAVYLGFFLVYGETVFDTDFGASETSGDGFLDQILSFVTNTVSFSGDILQFVTLGGFQSPLPGLLQAILFLTIGVGWFLVMLGLARGSPVS